MGLATCTLWMGHSDLSPSLSVSLLLAPQFQLLLLPDSEPQVLLSRQRPH